MKQSILLSYLLLTLVSSSCTQHRIFIVRYSARQQKLEDHLEKTAETLLNAPDSITGEKLLYAWWLKHSILIQDSLGFKSYPPNPDTFYFQHAFVKQITENQKKLIDVILINGNYLAHNYFDITDSRNLEVPLYHDLLTLTESRPVRAEIDLKDVYLNEFLSDSSEIVFNIRINIISIKSVE